ncbi:MAG: phosphotriesterase-related protein [Chloroflexota bacterium]
MTVGTIQTVLGPIEPAALGVTLTHEHVWCNQALCRLGDRWRATDPRSLMILDEPDVAVAELQDLHALGGRALVEATVGGWGRDVAMLRAISERSGIQIVAASGYYVEACLPSWTPEKTIDQLADVLVREATLGADGTDIRTGILKAAIGRGRIEGEEERCARAVARAQVRTGLPITTHTSGNVRFEIAQGNAGPGLLDLFESEGADLSAVIIGHTDENADIRVLETICRRGAFVQFDVIGKSHWMLDETRVQLARQLIDRGHGDRLLLSSDRARKTELRKYGGPGYGHVLRSFVPMLQAAGIEEAAIEAILVHNPAHALTRRPTP